MEIAIKNMIEVYDYMGDLTDLYLCGTNIKKRSTIRKTLHKYLLPDFSMIDRSIMPYVTEYTYPDLLPTYLEKNSLVFENHMATSYNHIDITVINKNVAYYIPSYGDILVGVYSENLPIIKTTGNIKISLLETDIYQTESSKKRLFVLETPWMFYWCDFTKLYIDVPNCALVYGFIRHHELKNPHILTVIRLPRISPDGKCYLFGGVLYTAAGLKLIFGNDLTYSI